MLGVDVVKMVVAPPRARVRVRVVVPLWLGLGLQRPLEIIYAKISLGERCNPNPSPRRRYRGKEG